MCRAARSSCSNRVYSIISVWRGALANALIISPRASRRLFAARVSKAHGVRSCARGVTQQARSVFYNIISSRHRCSAHQHRSIMARIFSSLWRKTSSSLAHHVARRASRASTVSGAAWRQARRQNKRAMVLHQYMKQHIWRGAHNTGMATQSASPPYTSRDAASAYAAAAYLSMKIKRHMRHNGVMREKRGVGIMVITRFGSNQYRMYGIYRISVPAWRRRINNQARTT